MGRQNSKYQSATRDSHIVSFQVNREEKTMIDRWARKNGMSTSSVLRAMFYSGQSLTDDVFSDFKEHKLSRKLNRINQ